MVVSGKHFARLGGFGRIQTNIIKGHGKIIITWLFIYTYKGKFGVCKAYSVSWIWERMAYGLRLKGVRKRHKNSTIFLKQLCTQRSNDDVSSSSSLSMDCSRSRAIVASYF